MATSTGWYLYAVTSSQTIDWHEAAGITGALPSGLELVSDGSLAAVASPFAGERVRPERRTLAAHHAVHRALLTLGVPFLPASFGILAPSREDLAELLRANRSGILDDLKRLAGKVEMGLKLVWDVPNIFEHFVFTNPELACQRDRLLTKPGGGTRDEKIELGRTFEAMLTEARGEHAATLRRALGKHVLDMQFDPVRDEKMIANLTLLIERGREGDFELAVFSVASRFDDHYALDYNGPWPPYHFVRVALREPGWERWRRERALPC